MDTTYEKTEDNKLRKIKTIEMVEEYTLRDLQGMRTDLALQIDTMTERLAELDALIAEAEDLGIIE